MDGFSLVPWLTCSVYVSEGHASHMVLEVSRRKSRVGVFMLDVIMYLFMWLFIPILFWMYQNIF